MQNTRIELIRSMFRRASLAVALLQEPELLILDEPTVGVDPLLRQTIWRHLTKISRTTTTTIIITTHYVEEARQAHRVGMMRFGRLLAEDAPAALIETYKQTSLENVFLSLCLKNGDDDDRDSKDSSVELDDIVTESVNDTDNKDESTNKTDAETIATTPREDPAVTGDDKPLKPGEPAPEAADFCYNLLQWSRLKALLVKNFIRMWRNLGFLVFQFIIPTVQVLH